MKFPFSKSCSVSTDGDSKMIALDKGSSVIIESKLKEEGYGNHCQILHSMVHRESLACKKCLKKNISQSLNVL